MQALEVQKTRESMTEVPRYILIFPSATLCIIRNPERGAGVNVNADRFSIDPPLTCIKLFPFSLPRKGLVIGLDVSRRVWLLV